MRILIVKLGAIGDIVHTLPAFSAIREALPDAEISWVVEKRSAEILRENPLIQRLIEVDTRELRSSMRPSDLIPAAHSQFKGLREGGFDVAIDFQGLIKSGLITRISGAKLRYGFARKYLREPASRIFLNRTAKIDPLSHKIKQNLDLARRAFGVDASSVDYRFPIFTAREHREEAMSIAARVEGRFAILNPAGGWVTKLWPAENFGILADRLWSEAGISSVMVTGPNEGTLAQRAMAVSQSGKLISVSPSLKGSFELARSAEIYIGGDTGPTHLALAAHTPIVGIFGPTEWWRNGSTDPDDLCVERSDIGCRVDCHRRTCSNWICMDISVETVFRSVVERLDRKLHQSGTSPAII